MKLTGGSRIYTDKHGNISGYSFSENSLGGLLIGMRAGLASGDTWALCTYGTIFMAFFCPIIHIFLIYCLIKCRSELWFLLKSAFKYRTFTSLVLTFTFLIINAFWFVIYYVFLCLFEEMGMALFKKLNKLF